MINQNSPPCAAELPPPNSGRRFALSSGSTPGLASSEVWRWWGLAGVLGLVLIGAWFGTNWVGAGGLLTAFLGGFFVLQGRRRVELEQQVQERTAALRESEEKHRLLFQDSPDAYLIIVDGVFVDCNGATEGMLRGDRTRIVGQPPEALSPEVQPGGGRSSVLARERIQAALATGKKSFEWVHRRFDGSDFTVEVSIVAMRLGGRPALLTTWRDITERKLAEERLRVSEEQHRLLLRHLPVGVMVHAPDSSVVLGNETATRQLGVSWEQMRGKTAGDSVWRLVRDDGQPMSVVEHPVSRVLATGQPVQNLVAGLDRPAGGDRIWVLVNAFPQFDAAGQLQQVGVTFIDITARKQAEEEAQRARARAQESLAMSELATAQLRQAQAVTMDLLKAAETTRTEMIGVLQDQQQAKEALLEAQALLQTAMDCSPAGIAIADAPDGRLRYVNRAGLSIRGGTEEELVTGVDIGKYVASWGFLNLNGTPMEPDEVPLAWVIQKGEPCSREFIIRRSATDQRVVWGNAAPVLDASGNLLAGIMVFIDITERKRAEAAHRISEARFSEFMAHLPAAVFIKDAFGRTLFANRFLADLQGKPWEPTAASANDEQARPITEDDLRALVGHPVVVEETVPDGRGADRVLQTIKFAICVPEQPAMLGSIALDITERQRAQAEVHRLNQTLERRVAERTAQLEASNRELEAFSYSVSHDLRAPLRAISGYAGILREDYGSRLDAEGLRVLDVVASEAHRMGVLIDDLLSFSRLGRLAVRRVPVNLQALVRTVFAELAAAVPERRLELTVAPLGSVTGDPALLRQVCLNLLGNAVKYTRPVAVAQITVGVRTDGEETIYFIRDNGVGFDMKYAGKLFGVFQRLHTEAQFEGTGVGLALVQRIIHRHGGRIWAEARLGAGATFCFTLPAGMNER